MSKFEKGMGKKYRTACLTAEPAACCWAIEKARAAVPLFLAGGAAAATVCGVVAPRYYGEIVSRKADVESNLFGFLDARPNEYRQMRAEALCGRRVLC